MESKSAATWDYAINQRGGSFLQSYAWGEFQRAYGRPVERWCDNSSAVQTIIHTLPAGRTYLFTPYGPTQTTDEANVKLIDHIQEIAEKHRAIFWRYERAGEKYGGLLVQSTHPDTTWITPLQTPDAMLKAMKSKWRYNIGLAERKGVTITTSTALADVDDCYRLLQDTAQRQHITLHPKSYYQLMVKALATYGCVQLYFAHYQEQIIASAIVIRFGTTTTYLHGGSLYAYRQLMAPHYLHWHVMQAAFAAGAAEYDWFGIAPAADPNHPFASITRFKQGFGGYTRSYPGTYELPLQRSWYNVYRLVKQNRLWI